MERIYNYIMDEEGGLWIEGTELTDPKVLQFFLRKMEKRTDGRFLVNCMGETNLITAKDVPYVVKDLHWGDQKIELIMQGGYRETLDPHSLFVGQKNVMYCLVRQGQFTARFQRQPYLELARHIEGNRDQGFYLNWQGEKFLIGEKIK